MSSDDVESRKKKIGDNASTHVVYVGNHRYSVLSQHAISVSFLTGKQVSAAQFAQYIIDEFGEEGEARLVSSIKNATPNP